MWCGVIGAQLIGPYIFPQRLTGDRCANFLQEELPALLENVPLQARRQMYNQHDEAPPHFSQVVRQYLNHKFRNRWIGRGGAQNWPPRSPDLNPLNYHVWNFMFMVPCIVICIIINRQDAAVRSQFYFTAGSLYMFRVLSTPIIRST